MDSELMARMRAVGLAVHAEAQLAELLHGLAKLWAVSAPAPTARAVPGFVLQRLHGSDEKDDANAAHGGAGYTQ